MIKRYFLVSDQKLSKKIIAKFNEAAKLREDTLEQLRKEFDLVGFVFANNGRPDYFLKDIGSEVDKTKFKVGRINRAGNDFTTLEPIGFEINDLLSLTFIRSLDDAVELNFPFNHIISLSEVESKKVEEFVILEVESSFEYGQPVELVEISESQYTNPDAEQLKTLI